MSLQLGLRLGLLSGGFTPASLFAAGEQGYWLDPSDFSTMFQDAAGTTPVTATGQSVRLMLDKSKGLALGAELIVDPSFDNPAAWTTTANTSVSGGVGRFISPTVNGDNISEADPLALIAGVYYLVTYTITNYVSGSVRPETVGGGSVSIGVGASGNGTYTEYLLAQPSNTRVRLRTTTTNASLDIASFSVRAVAGNHFTQANVANAPILGVEPFGGRRNLLTFTEQFDNAAWLKVSATVAADAGVAPDGTASADNYVPAAGTVSPEINRSVSGLTNGSAYTYSVYLKDTGSGSGWFEITLLNPLVRSFFDIRNGVKGVGAGSIQNVGGGWYRCSVPTTLNATTTILYVTPRSADGNSGPIVATAVPYALIWGAQLETGSTATAYQRVTDQWNVTQAGVADCYYLSFDGTDDWLQSAATIDPGAVDKVQVFAGVRKLSDAAIGMLVEASNTLDTNNGTFNIYSGTGPVWTWASKGTLRAFTNPSGFTAPITNVLTGIGDISGDSAILRVNGAQAASSTADQGTGNYLTYTHYIGRRGGTTLPFNGRVYQMVMRFGANLTAAQITQTENYVAGETGVYTLDQLNQFATLDASGVSYNAYGAADENTTNYLVPKTVLAADGTPYSVL